MKNTGTKMGILTTILSTAAVAIAEENIPATAAAVQSIPWIWWVAPLSSIAGLLVAYYFYKAMMTAPKGNEKMEAIASYVREGAYAYLFSQYRVVALVFFVLFLIFTGMAYVGIQNPFVPVAFITAGFFSALSGFLGMKTATQASSRTAQGAIHSLNRALQVAFRSGAVMGLVVVSFGLLNIAFWYWLLDRIVYTPEHMRDGLILWGLTLVKAGMDPASKLTEITTTMITFGMGASTQALFARVGGGIFTKAADVGADLVGKVEAGIPEDDPRNPATIADNVGDNVGDVAGMGADLFESYVGSILAAAALGAALSTQVLASRGMDPLKAVLAPSVVAGLGTILSIFGIFVVRCKEDASQKNLLRALLMGTLTSSILVVVALAILAMTGWISWGIFGAVITGLVAGVLIGQFTEYYTSDEYKPTREIAEQAQMGTGTVIITGFANGMMSSALPVVTIAVCIIAAYAFAGGFTDMAMGLYGIGFAAVGMLATLGITLSTDTYGPIADNAGGNAEMSGLGPEIRKKTDALDSLGNTTAATGKGFAIGSAALTAMAFIAANIEEIRIWIARLASESPDGVYKIEKVVFSAPGREVEGAINIATAHISDLLAAYDLTIMNPRLLAGLFIGAMMAFLFCAMTMKAVGRNAGRIVEEVRRQFREMPGIMEGKTKPDYARCVSIVTAGAQKEMILPSLLAIIVPIVAGIVIGIPGVMGLLTGALTCGFVLAVSLNNSGGAWDNAKKYIEKGNLGGKGSPAHKAAVVGDTVGDPFKDTSGPSLNILIKLMSMVSLVFTGVILKFAPIVGNWLHLR
ncbi:MAG: sodium-translocating pyrophosphatase [Sedimentisphaerales bacterium]